MTEKTNSMICIEFKGDFSPRASIRLASRGADTRVKLPTGTSCHTQPLFFVLGFIASLLLLLQYDTVARSS
jgi:hypothetical protein